MCVCVCGEWGSWGGEGACTLFLSLCLSPSPLIMPSVTPCRSFETQLSRVEAELLRREAPPSYGQLIAQGLIPPVEDFPVCSGSQVPAEFILLLFSVDRPRAGQCTL